MEFYNNLNSICKAKKTSISAVLLKCGYTKSYGTNWKNGTMPTIDMVIKLAECLEVSIDTLLGVNSSISKDESILLNTYRTLTNNGKKQVIDFIDKVADMETSNEFFIPTVKLKHSEYMVSAGVGVEIGDYNEWEYVEVPKTREAVKADYCLTIKGNSMSPKFNNGDVILVKDQSSVDIGQICVYNINNSGYVKKYGGDKLISLNPEYDDIIIPSGVDDVVKCCGLVIGKTNIV